MYLSHIQIKNFRLIKSVDLNLQKGINILLGENDSGKTGIIDAIRLILGTRDYERVNLSSDDFFVDATGRANNLQIQAEFEDLSDEEAKVFLEWIGIRGTNSDGSLIYYLRLSLNASRKDVNRLSNKYDREITYSITAGPDDVGSNLAPEVRDFLRCTYLKPLRDAEQELAARRGSRLSQILLPLPEIREQDNSVDPNTITGIVHSANSKVKEHPSIKKQSDTLNDHYLKNFTLGNGSISATINISDPTLKGILERLELSISDGIPDVKTNHGLGINNLLFMATELLLLGSSNSPELPLLLIEEPEAHLHPQLQNRLIEFLQNQTTQQPNTRPVQVILTSHSPNLASNVGLENAVLIHDGKAFPLGPTYSCLQQSDYKFLQRFLDVTKANLFFARGVIIVEGDAEQILLPTIAKLIDLPFEKHGVSIVNVGHIGLFRYSRIFQRRDGTDIGIRVACITDMDIPPDEASEYIGGRDTWSSFSPDEIAQHQQEKRSRASGGPVHTFVSPLWTLEFDLGYHNLEIALLLYQAILLAEESKKRVDGISFEKMSDIKVNAFFEFNQWRKENQSNAQIAVNIYKRLFLKKASKPETAQYLARLLEENFSNRPPAEVMSLFPHYIVAAINYVSC